jgi:hypothetical protein
MQVFRAPLTNVSCVAAINECQSFIGATTFADVNDVFTYCKEEENFADASCVVDDSYVS